MNRKRSFTPNRSRLVLLALCLVGVLVLTYYSKAVLGTGVVFTHFYYIPIVLACLWWRRKGLVVPAFLAMVLLLSHYVVPVEEISFNDLFRAGIFLGTGSVIALLAERLLLSDRALRETEALYTTIFEASGTAVMIVEEDTRISLVNKEFERLSGWTQDEVQGSITWKTFFHPDEIDRMLHYHRSRRISLENVPRTYASRFLGRDGEVKHVMLTVDMIPGTRRTVVSIMDITDRVLAEMDRAALQKRLESTLTKVLSGFVPICARCKKIRNETGTWVQIESYLNEHSDLQFSHGICPQCGKAIYGEILSDRGKDDAP